MSKKHLIIIIGITALVASFGAILVAGVIMYIIAVEMEDNENNMVEMNISSEEPYSTLHGSAQAEVIDGKIIYTNAGSGSCPPVLDEALYDAESDTYLLKIKKYHNKPCTMDLRGLKQTVTRSDDEQVPQDAHIVIE